jgi:hypothetical protein
MLYPLSSGLSPLVPHGARMGELEAALCAALVLILAGPHLEISNPQRGFPILRRGGGRLGRAKQTTDLRE